MERVVHVAVEDSVTSCRELRPLHCTGPHRYMHVAHLACYFCFVADEKFLLRELSTFSPLLRISLCIMRINLTCSARTSCRTCLLLLLATLVCTTRLSSLNRPKLLQLQPTFTSLHQMLAAQILPLLLPLSPIFTMHLFMHVYLLPRWPREPPKLCLQTKVGPWQRQMWLNGSELRFRISIRSESYLVNLFRKQ